MNRLKLRKMLNDFFIEDIGEQDLTSDTIFPMDQIGRGVFIAKEKGVLSGGEVIKEGYQLLDNLIEVKLHLSDGDFVSKGDVIAEVFGPVRYLLTGERVILNLLQRMSGIATL